MITRLHTEDQLRLVRTQQTERLAEVEAERRLRDARKSIEPVRDPKSSGVRQPLPNTSGSWSAAAR